MGYVNLIRKVVGGGGYSAKLLKTMQAVSYADYDDGYYQAGRGATFFLLPENNMFRHTQRFTGITGGYYNQALANWYDKNGNITTEILAMPENIVIDWATLEVPTGDVLMWHYIKVNYKNWQTAINECNAMSFGDFSNWRLPNINELIGLINIETNKNVGYKPFNIINDWWLWSGTTVNNNSANAFTLLTSNAYYLGSQNKTSSGNNNAYIPCRTANTSEL